MKNQEFQDKLNEMQEKIGQEASSLIMDDIGLLLSDNLNMNKEIEKKDIEISEQKCYTKQEIKPDLNQRR